MSARERLLLSPSSSASPCSRSGRAPPGGSSTPSGSRVGEFVAADKGLGYLTNYNTSLFSTTGALGGILVLAAVVVLCNEVLNRMEARLLRWRPREEGRSRDLY